MANEQNAVETTTNVKATENATRQSVADVAVDAEATGDIKSPEVEAEAEAEAPAEAAPEVEAAAPANTGANPAVEAVTAAMGDVVPKKHSRKAKLSSETTATTEDVVPDYAALGVAEQDVPKYEKLRLRFANLGRLETSQVFERGEVVHELHKLDPDQKAFAKSAKAVLGLSRRGAENYEQVHRNLKEHRARLVKLGLAASSLYVLATAENDKVETVVALAETGKKLSVAEVKTMVGIEGKAPASPDDGGPEGLRAAVAVKTAHATSGLFETLFNMLRELHIALEPHHEGRDINKGEAIEAVMHDARLAGGLIESLVYAAGFRGKPAAPGVVHVLIVEENRWSTLRRTLYNMGSAQSWPKDGKSGAWLAESVVPQFEWALGPVLAEKARKVLEERAAAKEDARVKAEADKLRAKADAKKARENAKRDKAKAEKQALREARAAAKGAKAATTAADAAVDGNANA